MTGPTITPHGYPDYNRQQAYTGLEWSRINNRVITVPDNLGPFYVGNSHAVGMRFISTGGRGRVTVNYWSDQGMTDFVGAEQFTIAANGRYEGATTPIGPWSSLVIDVPGANLTYSLTLWSAPFPELNLNNDNANVLISVTGQAIGAGATVTADATRTWPGMAHWTAGQIAGTFTVTLQGMDQFNIAQDLDRHDSVVAQRVARLVMLPARNARISITNTSGAPQTFDAYLVGQPAMFQG